MSGSVLSLGKLNRWIWEQTTKLDQNNGRKTHKGALAMDLCLPCAGQLLWAPSLWSSSPVTLLLSAFFSSYSSALCLPSLPATPPPPLLCCCWEGKNCHRIGGFSHVNNGDKTRFLSSFLQGDKFWFSTWFGDCVSSGCLLQSCQNLGVFHEFNERIDSLCNWRRFFLIDLYRMEKALMWVMCCASEYIQTLKKTSWRS